MKVLSKFDAGSGLVVYTLSSALDDDDVGVTTVVPIAVSSLGVDICEKYETKDNK